MVRAEREHSVVLIADLRPCIYSSQYLTRVRPLSLTAHAHRSGAPSGSALRTAAHRHYWVPGVALAAPLALSPSSRGVGPRRECVGLLENAPLAHPADRVAPLDRGVEVPHGEHLLLTRRQVTGQS